MKYKNLTIFFLIIMFFCPSLLWASTRMVGNWYLGLGLGTGVNAGYTVNDERISFDEWLSETDRTPKIFLNLKGGMVADDEILLGLDFSTLKKSADWSNDINASIQINNYFIVATYFPFKEGFFLRAGGGISSIKFEITKGNIGIGYDKYGYGILLGIGYAFWVGDSFNVTVNLESSCQSYSSNNIEDEVTGSDFTSLYVGFDLY